MGWNGYFTFGGTEVINVQRTEEYATKASLTWFKPLYKDEVLGDFLGQTYGSPLNDINVPWTDPDEPASYDFYGFYPLEITGLEDSTLTATVIESTLDGGVVGRPRRATRSIVFSGVLIAESECGAEYGMRWLKSALAGFACNGTSTCAGTDLCYLSCEPCIIPGCADQDGCFDNYIRTLKRVSLINGPTVERKMPMTDGGEAWAVTFTLVAANPSEFGAERPFLTGFMDPNVAVPFPDGNLPEGASWDSVGFVQNDPVCPKTVYQPIFDPLCPLVVPPPSVPSIALACFNFPVNYLRRQAVIPDTEVPLWGEAVPVIRIHARDAETRSLRLRFYADATGQGDPNIDPCSYCGDIVFSYIPLDHTLVFDGVEQQVYVESAATGKRRADSLVFKSDGTPFEWPQLSCGFGYIVTFDLPQTQTPPVVDLSLVTRAV